MMRMTSAVPNMRATIGLNKASTITLDVEGNVYKAELKYADSNTTYMMFGAGTTCSGWQEIATTTTEQLSLLNGWVTSWSGVEPLIGRSGNIVTITGVIMSGTTENGTVIANLPSQYKPSKSQCFIITDWGGNKRYTIEANSNGTLRIAYNNSIPWDNGNKVLQVTYSI